MQGIGRGLVGVIAEQHPQLAGEALDHRSGAAEARIPKRPMSVERLEWEHMQKVLADCGGNVSVAARMLNMHRRTLQRKLSKHPAPEHTD